MAFVASGPPQRLVDQRPFQPLHRLLQIQTSSRPSLRNRQRRRSGSLRLAGTRQRKIRRKQRLAIPAQNDRALHRVLQLTHIPGPVIALQNLDCLRKNALHRHALGLADLLQKMIGQRRYILPTVPQRRNVNRHDVQPVIEVFPELAVFNSVFQFRVRRRDHPNIQFHRLPAAQPLPLPLLQHPQQLGLNFKRQIPDLVQEYSAALRLLKPPHACLHCPGKRAPRVAEKLCFQQRIRQRRAIHGYDRRPRARAGRMQCPRDHLFSRSRFALNQHRAPPRSQDPNRIEDRLHDRAVPD